MIILKIIELLLEGYQYSLFVNFKCCVNPYADELTGLEFCSILFAFPVGKGVQTNCKCATDLNTTDFLNSKLSLMK